MNTCDWPVALRRMRSQQLIMLICAPLIILKENLKMQQNVASAVKTTQSTHVHTGSQRCVNGEKMKRLYVCFIIIFILNPGSVHSVAQTNFSFYINFFLAGHVCGHTHMC